MITITPQDNGFLVSGNSDENELITKILIKYPRKFERRIEEFLADRKRNIREQENMLIMSNMTEEERIERLNEIELSVVADVVVANKEDE